jgi:WD40 repeat protein
MENYGNENIIKLIFSSLAFYDLEHAFDVSNASLYKIVTSFTKYQELGKTNTILKAHQSTINSLAQISNRYIITVSNDETAKVWDVDNFKCVKELQHKGEVKSVVKLSEEFFATCCRYHIYVWKSNDEFECLDVTYFHNRCFFKNLALLSNGELAVICENSEKGGREILIICWYYWRIIKYIFSYKCDIMNMVSLPDGFAFVHDSNLKDSFINIWGKTNYKFLGFRIPFITKYECLKVLCSPIVSTLLYNEKDNLLISGSSGMIRFWDLISYECIRTVVTETKDAIRSILVLPNGYFASCIGDYVGKIKLWNIKSCREVNELKIRGIVLLDLLLLRDGSLVSTSTKGEIVIWSY